MTTPQPQNPNQVPQQPAPQKKKGGCLKWGGIGLGAIIVLGVIANLTGGGDTTDKATSSANSSSTSATTSAAPLVDQPETSEAKAPEADVPAEYKSALKQADTYANTMHMSKAGVYDQLISEYGGQFTPEAAQYGIDNVQTDWNKNALESAKTYQETMAMSPAAIYDQLISEYGGKFTPEEAQYAVDNL